MSTANDGNVVILDVVNGKNDDLERTFFGIMMSWLSVMREWDSSSLREQTMFTNVSPRQYGLTESESYHSNVSRMMDSASSATQSNRTRFLYEMNVRYKVFPRLEKLIGLVLQFRSDQRSAKDEYRILSDPSLSSSSNAIVPFTFHRSQ
jgi:hypothetical protein